MALFSRFSRSKEPKEAEPLLDLLDPDFLRRLESLALSSRRAARGLLRGEQRTKKRGSGVEFADHRPYAEGDDIRFLDISAYQRFGKLLLRVFEEEEDQSVYLLVDVSASMGSGSGRKLQQAQRLAAALGYVALTSLDRVTLASLTDRVVSRMPTVRGKQHLLTLLRFLAGLRAEGSTDLGRALGAFTAQHRRRGLCILISDLHDPRGFEQAINVLRYRRFEVGVIELVDRADARVPLRGDLRLVDVETGRERLVTVTDALAREAEQELDRRRANIERFCRAKGVAHFSAEVDTPFERVVLNLLARGSMLK